MEPASIYCTWVNAPSKSLRYEEHPAKTLKGPCRELFREKEGQHGAEANKACWSNQLSISTPQFPVRLILCGPHSSTSMVVWDPAERSCRSGLGASLGVYLPQVYPAGTGTMPGRATAPAEKPRRSCHKVATFGCAPPRSSWVARTFWSTLGGICARPFRSRVTAGHEASSPPGATALLRDGGCISPSACSVAVLPWACRVSLFTDTSSKTCTTHFSYTEKKVGGQGPTHL